MAFVKGNFYKCISSSTTYSSLALTTGKTYEALDVDTYMSLLQVDSDNGYRVWVAFKHFDPAPVSSLVPSPVAAHAAWKAGLNAPPDAPAKPANAGPACSCGQWSEKKTFDTFSYFYCKACKKEVDEPKAQIADVSLSVAMTAEEVRAAVKRINASLSDYMYKITALDLDDYKNGNEESDD